MSTFNHYQLKLKLKDSNPVIWRRIRVSGTMSLTDLHVALQVAMGWEDEEVFEFEANGVIYSCDEEFVDENHDNPAQKVLLTDDVTVDDMQLKEKQHFIYIYDFDCDWEHEMIVEQVLQNDIEFEIPHCLSGEGACPVEKIGGLSAYYNLLNSIRDPKDDKYAAAVDLLGADFDENAFDLKATNTYLAEVFSANEE